MVVRRVLGAIKRGARAPMHIAKGIAKHKGKIAAGAALAYGAKKAYDTGKAAHKVYNGVGKGVGKGMAGLVKAGIKMG